MSAPELIKHVAALPPEERERFMQLLHEMENGLTEQTGAARWPDFGTRLRRIYANKVVPDSQQI